MTKKLLLYPAIDQERYSRITALEVDVNLINARSLEEAKAEIVDADGFYGKITPDLLELATQLTWVQSPTASLEHYVFDELIDHPCDLTNMKGLFYDVIADHVMCYVLMFARRMHLYMRAQMRSEWSPIGGENERSSFTVGPGAVTGMDRAHMHVADCTMGVVGCGSIGAEICARASDFGMNVIAVDPDLTTEPRGVTELRGTSDLPWLLENSDFVVIAAPHTPETEGLFDEELISTIKQGAYLINIGRGVIVKLDALTAALESGHLSGAALDVYETEPLPKDHPLWTRDDVILTPHVAACSIRVPERHLETLLENIRRFASDQPLLNVTNKARWY